MSTGWVAVWTEAVAGGEVINMGDVVRFDEDNGTGGAWVVERNTHALVWVDANRSPRLSFVLERRGYE